MNILFDKIVKSLIKTEKYLIVYTCYMDDDFYEFDSEVMVVDTEDVAKGIVEKLNAVSKTIGDEQELISNFRCNWELQNKMPIRPTLLNIPKWKAGLSKEEITTEMKDKREEIKKQNEIIVNDYSVVWGEWRSNRERDLLEYMNNSNLFSYPLHELDATVPQTFSYKAIGATNEFK